MNRQEYLLECLSEECNEVGQRVSKALRFGMSEVQPGQALSNADRIVDELEDLISVARILQAERVLPEFMPSQARIAMKQAKIEKFMAISRAEGTLIGEAHDHH